LCDITDQCSPRALQFSMFHNLIIIYRYLVGLFGWGTNLSAGLYPHRTTETHTYIHALSESGTNDPRV
jgi:hypothetical protein